MKYGTVQRTTWSGPRAAARQYFPGIWQWEWMLRCSRTSPSRSVFRFRLQADFFNVLNDPGNPNSFIGNTGICNVQSSGQSDAAVVGTVQW